MKPIANTAILFEASLIFVAWGLGYLLNIPIWQQLTATWLALGWGLLATLPLLAGLMWLTHTHWPPFAQLRRFVQEQIVPLFADTPLWKLALIALAAGVGEELLFRGLIQTWLTTLSSAWLGLLGASLIFGLLHAITPLYAILTTLIGLYLGLLFIRFNNLAVPIIVHALYDFVALFYLVRLRAAVK